jgi:penicillin-binding protein 2
MATAVAAIANGGVIYKPRLVRAIVPKDGTPPIVTEPEIRSRVDIDSVSLDTIRQFSIGVVNDPSGTGKRAKLPGIVVAGKTGTAQVGVLGKEKLDDKFKDHAWFVSFAPADHPIVATAVIVENSGHGGEFAAPISRQVMEAFFRKRGMLQEPAVEIDNSAIAGEEDDSAEPEVYLGEELIRAED